MKISPGESQGDLGISSLLHCRQPVQSQLLVCEHLQSRLRGALEAAWRRIPHTYRWDPHPLPAPDTTTRSDHAPQMRRGIWHLQVYHVHEEVLVPQRISSRTCWDALSFACMLRSGKKNCLLPLYGVVYLYVKWRQCLPSRGIEKLN